jgi:hypothetical protein
MPLAMLACVTGCCCSRPREVRQRQRLQPDFSGPGQTRDEEPVAAEDHVADAGQQRDVEVDRLAEHADVTRMGLDRFARGEIVGDDFAAELDPRRARAAELLHDEAVAAEHARAERTLKAHREFDALRRAQEPMAVNHVALARRDGDFQDAARHFRGERHEPGSGGCGELGHEQAAAGDRTSEDAEYALGAGRHRGGVHGDRLRHPRELAGFGNDLIAGLESDLQDR